MKTYTVNDIKKAECTLEPIKCKHCNHVGEVVYNQTIGDGYCQICGKWQNDE
ncbi:MAG: hypothetical protein ACOCRK_07050 [bacterium]